MASSIMTESAFPYFFVGTFIEANVETGESFSITGFPYFFVGTFIEARSGVRANLHYGDFPTFS